MYPGIRTLLVPPVLLLALAGCGDDGDSTATDPASGDASGSGSSSTAPSASPSASDSAAGSASASPSLPSTSDTATITLPDCASVWVVGQKLPANYIGCTDAGEVVQAEGLYCEFGKPLFSFGTRFYAVENGPINKTAKTLAKDKTYQQAVRKCGG